MSDLGKFARLVQLEHALFALPFGLSSMLYAAGGLPPGRVIFLAVLALMAGRSLGMACNRLIDRKVDAKNPRTADRQLPRGEIGVVEAKLFAFACAVVLGLAAWALNPLAFALLPVAFLLLVGYSYAKFYTPACHLVLGMTHASAVGGAWIAVTGRIDPPLWFLAGGVALWTAGFDIVYSCQDLEVDRTLGLRSIPAALGRDRALDVATTAHVLAWSLLWGFGWCRGTGSAYATGMLVIAALLVFEHVLARRQGDAAIQKTFFLANAAVSLVFLATALVEVFGAGARP